MKTYIRTPSLARISGGVFALLIGASLASAQSTNSTTPSRETPPPAMDTPSKSTPDTTLNYDDSTVQPSSPMHAGEKTPPDMDTPSMNKTETDMPASGKMDMVKSSDERCLKKIARLGMEEVMISKIAADRAIDPQVRSFAAEMVKAHTAANAELKALAAGKGVMFTMPDAIEARKMDKKWMDKKGNDFDEDYLDAAIDNHEDTIDALENAAESKDAQISAWADKMLPVVKEHLEHAKSIKKMMK